jgi:hypothetical protein
MLTAASVGDDPPARSGPFRPVAAHSAALNALGGSPHSDGVGAALGMGRSLP